MPIQALPEYAGKTVLVVDAEVGGRTILGLLFRRLGFAEVLDTGDGTAALQITRERRPDLILSDLLLAGMNGWDFLAAVRADPDLKPIPFIVLTARADAHTQAECLDLGADLFLTKPLGLNDPHARIQEAFDHARTRTGGPP